MSFDPEFVTKVQAYLQDIRRVRTDLSHAESNATLAYDKAKAEIDKAQKDNQARCPHVRTRHWGQGYDSSDHGEDCEDCGKAIQ